MGLAEKHLVVVGAGIGGSVVALLAARAGARVTLLERDARPRSAPSGVVLHPNALAVLYGLDLDERLLRRGVRLTRLRLADSRGRTIVETSVPQFGRGLDHALVLRRDELAAALAALVAAEPGITLRAGCEAVGASPLGDVTYRTANGCGGLHGDVVVGVDGARSAVRRHGPVPGHVSRGPRYFRGIGPALPIDGLTEYWTAFGLFGVAPLRHASYFYASADGAPVARALGAGDVRGLRDAWGSELPIAATVLDRLERVEDVVVEHAVRVDCARWTEGRVVLLGDAAHAMAPNLGQGVGSALADAVVLVWELAQPGPVAAALSRYEERRRSAVRPVQDVAGLLAALSERTPRALHGLRDGALRLFGPRLLGELGMRLVEQLDPLWLQLAAQDPGERLVPPWLVRSSPGSAPRLSA